ncbi:FecR family protein [Rufibacter sediminis]|uniref:FecR domain-containing protein n=1 Tax=Rufibacter sediminis TaxID=2762756 RepID=A0ABR6VPL1_9BACT|nr:FecR domain-containing protein [Rufibacter sediminis]MBC3539129.1 FecR domain-containing protein [Rufibacter sediminis]
MEGYLTLHDFVLDPRFCNWALGKDDSDTLYWEAFIKANPEKVEQIEQAKAVVRAMVYQNERTWLPLEKAEVWSKIQHRVAVSENSGTEALGRRAYPIWKEASRLAASLIGLIMVSVALYYFGIREQRETVQYATRHGQVKRVVLPDGSEVVLNANSILSFEKPWNSESTRKVSLKGEAFFKVSHQENDQKFKVLLQDNVSIEVLGTQFTATQRSHVCRVVLSEGKVNFSVTDDILLGLYTSTIKQETLKPGELATWNGQNDTQALITKEKPAHLEIYEAFQHNKLMFEDAPLIEVARVLEDVYGFEVTFSNKELVDRRFTGSVPHDNVEVLFIALEKLFDLKVIKTGHKLEFR